MDRVLPHEVREEILDAAVARIEAHMGEGGILEEIAKFVRADRTSDALEFPLLGLGTRPMDPTGQTTFSITWQLPLRLSVQVVDHDADRGYRDAHRLASLAFTALFTDPETGEAEDEIAGYPLSAGQIEPPMQASGDNTLFMARANALTTQINTTF